MTLVPIAVGAVLASGAFAQNILTNQQIVSAKSGVIQYYEGTVLNGDKAVETRNGHFESLKDGAVLKTEAGRAEVLLQPSVFLRVGEDSSIEMLATKLTDTQVRVHGGTAIVEVGDAEFNKQYGLKFFFKDSAGQDVTVDVKSPGLFRIDVAESRVRVYKGELLATVAGEETILRTGKEMTFGATPVVARFDPKLGDPLYRWASRRAEYHSTANVASASALRSTGSRYGTGGWLFNPYYGMFTYMPYSGIYNSPFGYAFYSPGRVFVPYPGGRYSGGNSGGGTSSGFTGVSRGPVYNQTYGYNTYDSRGAMASSSPVSSAPASSAPAPSMGRGGDSSGGRGAGGGGRR